MSTKTVPAPTLRRLPKYLNYLKELRDAGQTTISASKVAEALDIQHTQVRKDFAYTGAEGVPKVGHQVEDLIKSIESFLNWDNVTDAFLVGVGHLGAALLGYNGFQNSGINIIAAFDVPEKSGQNIAGIEVYSIEKFAKMVSRMKVKVGIITVPSEFAQDVAKMMIESGIEAIWNFAPRKLDLPEEIIVENVDMYSSLALISHRLKKKFGK